MDVDEYCSNCAWPYGLTIAKFYDKDDFAMYVFRQHGVLPSTVQCPHCGSDCKLHSHGLSKVSLRWRCQKTYESPVGSGKRKRCNFLISDRKGTFLEKCHIPPWKLMIFINHYLSKYFDYELLVAEFHFSTKTVTDWRSFCSEVCISAMADQAAIGGPGKIVEIDESHFGKAKYGRGRQLSDIWVFGGIERGSTRKFAVPLTGEFSEAGSRRRDKPTLLPLIEKYILLGTLIMSDGWKANEDIALIEGKNYTHKVVNHSECYVDPTDRTVHTQNIERMWRSMKEDYARPGIRAEYFNQYIARFLFREKSDETPPDGHLHRFLRAAAKLYPHGSVRAECESDSCDE